MISKRRRQFLLRTLGAAAGIPLSGCDRLSQSAWFTRMLGSAEGLNRSLHHALARSDSLAEEFTETDLSAHFPANGSTNPADAVYRRLAAGGFQDWQLEVTGLVANARKFSLDDLRDLPSRTQITRHDCVEGWSAIAQWKGVRMAALLDEVRPKPEARFVVFRCYDSLEAGSPYYESIDFEDALHPQTLLAYEWNNQLLPIRYGAPLRLRVERQLGYKMAKYIRAIEVVDSLSGIYGGKGGYWEDRGYAWYAGI